MLRLCQGQLSPLDGVSLTLCPKALHRLAEQCCEREGVKRPDLTNLAAQLQGPVLHQLDPDTLQARRPATRLCGWRAAAEAANPALVRQRSEPAASDQTGVARSLFETYDADGSATLDASELRQLCLSMGREMTVDEAEATLKKLRKLRQSPESQYVATLRKNNLKRQMSIGFDDPDAQSVIDSAVATLAKSQQGREAAKEAMKAVSLHPEVVTARPRYGGAFGLKVLKGTKTNMEMES